MVRMFCTPEEAAKKLNATETELETLLEDGALQDFRAGSSRFLKIADVDALLAGQGPIALQPPPETRSKTKLPKPTDDSGRTSADAEEIRLPACAAVRVRTRHPQSRPAAAPPAPRRRVCAASRNLPPRQPAVPRGEPCPAVRGVPSAPAFPAYRVTPQTREMSLREWLWTGLRDDQPHTLIVLALTVLAGTCGVIGGSGPRTCWLNSCRSTHDPKAMMVSRPSRESLPDTSSAGDVQSGTNANAIISWACRDIWPWLPPGRISCTCIWHRAASPCIVRADPSGSLF